MAEEKVYSEFKYENELLSPYNHLLQVKGKRLRFKIILAFNYWLKVPDEKVHQIFDILNMLHNAALLIDDIEDNSIVRRGLPAAHCIYGLPMTINAAFHALLLVFQKLVNISPQAEKIFIEHFLEVVRGQGLDVYWRENSICPTEAQYMDMAQRKNGAYYFMAIRMLQSFSEDKTDYSMLALPLGTYFQIRDDYCNLSKPEALEEWPSSKDTHANKASYCEDLTEGKFSFPIVHAINRPGGNEILNILRQRTRDTEIKKHCMSLLEKSGSLQYTRKVLLEFDKSARAEALEEWPSSKDTHANEASYCEDLTEGKFSFPIVHAINRPGCNEILNILRQRTRDTEIKKHCLSLLEKSGSLQYTRKVLLEFDKSARAEVARLGGNPMMESVLDDLLSWQE